MSQLSPTCGSWRLFRAVPLAFDVPLIVVGQEKLRADA